MKFQVAYGTENCLLTASALEVPKVYNRKCRQTQECQDKKKTRNKTREKPQQRQHGISMLARHLETAWPNP